MMSPSLDGWWLFPRSAALCLCLIIFICVVMKIIFSPFSLTVSQAGIFVGGCVMSLSDRALEIQRLLLLLFHLQDTKHQTCIKDLNWGSTEGPTCNLGACRACWDLEVGGWRNGKYKTHSTASSSTSCLFWFIFSFIQQIFLECLLCTRHYSRQRSSFRTLNPEVGWWTKETKIPVFVEPTFW